MKKLPCFTKPKNRDGYYFTPTVNGKTKWIPLGNDKQAALEKYHIYMQGESRNRSVNEALDLYLDDGGDIDLTKTSLRPFSDLAPQTQKSYRQAIAKIRAQFGKRELVSLKPSEVTQWVVTMPDGNRAIAMLNNIFELGKFAGFVETNPLKNQVVRLKPAKRVRHVRTEEMQAVYNAARPTLKVVMGIAMRTGLRVSDVLEITPEMIDGDSLVVAVQKTKRHHRVLRFPLTDGLRELVMATPFKTPRGMKLKYTTLIKWWWKACEDAGVENLKVHDIRRWAIQQADALERGAGRRLADHSSESMTATYLAGAPVHVPTLNVSDLMETSHDYH